MPFLPFLIAISDGLRAQGLAARAVRARHLITIKTYILPGEFMSGPWARGTGQTTQYLARSANYLSLGNEVTQAGAAGAARGCAEQTSLDTSCFLPP